MKRPFVATGLRVEDIRRAGAFPIDEDYVEETGAPLMRRWSLATFTDKRLPPALLWLALSRETPILPSADDLALDFADLRRRVMLPPLWRPGDGRGGDGPRHAATGP